MMYQGVSGLTINATITELKFLFEITLYEPEVITKLSTIPVSRKLSIVLSLEEVKRFMVVIMDPN